LDLFRERAGMVAGARIAGLFGLLGLVLPFA